MGDVPRVGKHCESCDGGEMDERGEGDGVRMIKLVVRSIRGRTMDGSLSRHYRGD